MARLNGAQIAQLQQAILGAFSRPEDFDQFLQLRLDKRLLHIARLQTSYPIVVSDVIAAAENGRWIGKLLDALAAERTAPTRRPAMIVTRVIDASLVLAEQSGAEPWTASRRLAAAAALRGYAS